MGLLDASHQSCVLNALQQIPFKILNTHEVLTIAVEARIGNVVDVLFPRRRMWPFVVAAEFRQMSLRTGVDRMMVDFAHLLRN